jgi:hypothetical protein
LEKIKEGFILNISTIYGEAVFIMTVEHRDEELIDNPDVADKIEWMKERLGLKTNEELYSRALSLIHQTIQLEDKGYHIGAWKDNMLDRDVIRYRILPQK